MAVLNPLKVVITNWEDGKVEMMDIENNPEDENSGKRSIPFSKEVWIEAEDFMEEPPKGFHRLTTDGYFRLKGAYILKHVKTIKNTVQSKGFLSERTPFGEGGIE